MSSAAVDSPLWLQCIKCLLNLLVVEKTIKEFCDNDGIITIAEGLKETKDPVAKQYLTYLVANILTVDDFVPTFIEEDGVKLIYPLLQDASKEIAVNAARAVSNLCTTLDEPRAAILEDDGVKALSKALKRPELFVYALKISRSLALCTKKAESFKDEEFIKEVSKFLRASDTTLRSESVKVFLNLARTSEMRRYIFQEKVLESIVSLAINDPEKDIRYDSLRVCVSMSSEGRVRKWANENGVVNSVKRMSSNLSLPPELKNQSQILLKNLSIAYEKSYSDGNCKSLDITAKYRSSQPSSPSSSSLNRGVQKSNVGGYKQQAVQGKTVFAKKQQTPTVVNKKIGPSPVVHKMVPTVKKVTPQPKTSPSPPKPSEIVQKKVAPYPSYKTSVSSTLSQVPKVQQKYLTPKTSTPPTFKPSTTGPKLQQPSLKSVPSTSPVTPQKKVLPSSSPSSSQSSSHSSQSSSSSSSTGFSESSSVGSFTVRDVDGSSVVSDSSDYLSEEENIPILSAVMQAELLAKQRAAVIQARIEEEIARERAEKEARRREEEERRKAEEEAKERAAEEARKREAEARRKAEAEKLRKAAEEEKKRIEEESKRKIDQIMSELKHSKEEEIQEKIMRENEEKEAKKKEIEERKRLEEARQAEEEARRREEAEAAARKKRKAEERAARQERKRLEKERKAKEEAAAKRAEEEAKLRALEEEQRKAKEREERERLEAKEKEDARKKHIRRTYIVQEIFDTEKNYVEGLTFMINGYMQPLLEKCQSKRDMIITQQQIKLIFSNVEIILNYASMLLELLQNRMEAWSETTCIGDVFLSITPFFASYIDYVNNYPSALEMLNKLHANERFQAFLDRVEKERPDLYLPSVIAFPIQRIPRYILLLADLLKHTDKEHPDYENLEKAVDAVREAGIHINERKRENENSTKLCQIQSSIKGKASQIFVSGRRFVSETNIGIVKKMGAAPRIGVGYLFSDSVLVARSLPKSKVLFKCLVPYTSLGTEILEDSRNMTNGLKIINKSPNPKDKHSEWVITFDSKGDRKAWLDSVAENSKEFEEKRKQTLINKH